MSFVSPVLTKLRAGSLWNALIVTSSGAGVENGDCQTKVIEIEVRLFNSLQKYHLDSLRLEEGSTVGDALRLLAIPDGEIYLTLLNGRNIMQSLGGGIEREHSLQQGDVLALSGPVPFSRAYGAPVV